MIGKMQRRRFCPGIRRLDWYDRGKETVSSEYRDVRAETGWVSPLTEEDKEFFRYFRMMCRRYNIVPSKATQMEYDFVTKVAESEFYLQRASVM